MGWWFCLPSLLPEVCREAWGGTGGQYQRSSFQLSALQKAAAKSPVQVSALSCISWDGLKEKLQGFHRALGDSFREKNLGGTNGSGVLSSLSFSVGFGYQIVSHLKTHLLFHGVTFKTKIFLQWFSPVKFSFCYKGHFDRRKKYYWC